MKASETTRHESEQREEATHPSESNVLTLEEFTRLLTDLVSAHNGYMRMVRGDSERAWMDDEITQSTYYAARARVLAAYSRALKGE